MAINVLNPQLQPLRIRHLSVKQVETIIITIVILSEKISRSLSRSLAKFYCIDLKVLPYCVYKTLQSTSFSVGICLVGCSKALRLIYCLLWFQPFFPPFLTLIMCTTKLQALLFILYQWFDACYLFYVMQTPKVYQHQSQLLNCLAYIFRIFLDQNFQVLLNFKATVLLQWLTFLPFWNTVVKGDSFIY